ncbi:hypothetical protein XENTR_v10005832 [Xenopus tropicalis]|nr:hypothetical protein XENTR_v10005832 [Xenopus tropicalis]KAE8624101.1 hypothetical protein XENTR_v10005832 [Xenopus tropicalis]
MKYSLICPSTGPGLNRLRTKHMVLKEANTRGVMSVASGSVPFTHTSRENILTGVHPCQLSHKTDCTNAIVLIKFIQKMLFYSHLNS